MTKTYDDMSRWQVAEEGQFFERKSALHRDGDRRLQRGVKELAHDISDTLLAMANADGGELVVGIENDGTITGVPHSAEKIRLFLGVPKDKNYLHPPLSVRSKEVLTEDGKRLLHFEVEWSPTVHLLADSRCLLRVRDRNEPFDKDKVKALKETKTQGLFERTFPAGARIADLDEVLTERLAEKVSPGSYPHELLSRYHLTEGRNGNAMPTLAALLLFGRDPSRWHDRCGIDFVRWEGAERKSGAELNIAKRFRVEAPLAVILEKAFEAIKPFIRERQQLHDLFFVEKLEYPTFAWQEAIVNAVAHRDYSIRGMGIEVWMFDDRMEIRSPGLPPSPVTLDALAQRKHMHCSRNPLIVRVLTTLGYMRELGEGVPRMFDEMERIGHYPPRFDAIGGAIVQVTLRNEPIHDRATLEWLQKFKNIDLSGDQKRMLAYAHAHDRKFTSRNYQDVIKTDIYGTSAAIKDMIRKGVVRSLGKGSRIYEVKEPLLVMPGMPPEIVRLIPVLQRKGRLTNFDVRQTLGLTKITAVRLLQELVAGQWLTGTGKRGVGAMYSPGPRLLTQSQAGTMVSGADTMTFEDDTMKFGKRGW